MWQLIVNSYLTPDTVVFLAVVDTLLSFFWYLHFPLMRNITVGWKEMKCASVNERILNWAILDLNQWLLQYEECVPSIYSVFGHLKCGIFCGILTHPNTPQMYISNWTSSAPGAPVIGITEKQARLMLTMFLPLYSLHRWPKWCVECRTVISISRWIIWGSENQYKHSLLYRIQI